MQKQLLKTFWHFGILNTTGKTALEDILAFKVPHAKLLLKILWHLRYHMLTVFEEILAFKVPHAKLVLKTFGHFKYHMQKPFLKTLWHFKYHMQN
jgi:hypothetical protein